MLLTVQPQIQGKTVSVKAWYGYGWERRDWNLAEIVQHVTIGGAISVANLRNDHRDESEFLSAQLIGVDFDDNAPNVDFFRYEEELAGQYAFYIGPTFNSTPELPRTRVLFALEQPVTDPNLYRRYVLKLLHWYAFLTPDPSCKDPVRMFFGSFPQDYEFKDVRLPLAVLEQLPDPPPLAVVSKTPQASAVVQRPMSAVLSEGVAPGERNNTALRMVGHLANVLPPEEITAIMQLWYDQKVSSYKDFPFSVVQSMIDRMTGKSAGILEKVRATVKQERTLAVTPAPTQAANNDFRTTAFTDFIGTTDQPIEWVIRDWLPAATTGGITAPPESYKTWLALAMAVSVATGEPFLGEYEVTGRSPVLVIQQEDSKGLLRQRLRVIYAELWRDRDPLGADPDVIELPVCEPDIHIYEGDHTFRFDNPAMMQNLWAYVETYGIKLVLLDPLYAATDANDYMAKDAQRMVELKRIRDKYGCSFLVVHHTRKTVAETGVDRQDAWGSQFLNAWLEMGIQIRKKGANKFKLFRHFKLAKQTTEQILEVDISTEPEDYHFRMKVYEETDQTLDESYEDKIMGVVKDANNGKLTGKKIAEALGKSPSWVSDGMGKTVLGRLVKMGKLKTAKQGNGTVYVSTELADF